MLEARIFSGTYTSDFNLKNKAKGSDTLGAKLGLLRFCSTITISSRFLPWYCLRRSRGSSGSIVSDYGLDDRAIGVRSPAGEKDFFV
jgi:hypothetical protein